MPKTSQLTGTQKKANKEQAKAQRVQAKIYQKQAPAEYKNRKTGQHAVKDIGKGRHVPEYKGKTKYEPTKFKSETKYEPTKFKPKTEYEHKTLGQLTKDFERAGRGLEPMFEARKQAALADFKQNLAPEIQAKYGASSSGSSALFQAQNAAKENLQRHLSADFEGMRNQIAGGLLNSREQQRQFGAQFGAGQEQFYNQLRNQQQQFGANFGGAQEQFNQQLRNQQQQYGSQFDVNQEQNRYNSQLHALDSRLKANALLAGSPINTSFSPLQHVYNQTEKGPSIGASVASGFIQGLSGQGGGGIPNAISSGINAKYGLQQPQTQNVPIQGIGFGGAQPGFF